MSGGDLVRLRARTRMIWAGDTLLLQFGGRDLRIPGFGDAQLAALHELRAGCTMATVRRSPWMSALEADGFLEAAVSPSDDPDIARFDRFLNYLSEFEGAEADRFDLLEQLRSSRVLLVGLGGLASWVVYNLLCCAVGQLTLVDNDVVEASNLNRSILYTEEDIGRPKVLAAADRIAHFAPRTRIRAEQRLVTGPQDLRDLAADADLIVGMADQPPWLIKEWVTAAALAAAKPVVQASGSRVGPFRTVSGSACSICDWTHHADRRPGFAEMLYRQGRLPRGDSGALSALGAITSGVLAMDVIRYFLGRTPRTHNRVWELRGDLTAGFTDCPPNPRCGVCGSGEGERVPTPDESMSAR